MKAKKGSKKLYSKPVWSETAAADAIKNAEK
jgi:hypothetical protein